MRLPSTPVLIWLAILLPLLLLLSVQFGAYCDEQGECSVPVRIVSWLEAPLAFAWLVVLAGLVVRAARGRRSGRE